MTHAELEERIAALNEIIDAARTEIKNQKAAFVREHCPFAVGELVLVDARAKRPWKAKLATIQVDVYGNSANYKYFGQRLKADGSLGDIRELWQGITKIEALNAQEQQKAQEQP